MDSLFFQIVLLLAGGELEDSVSSPPESTSTIVGAVVSKRKQHTRLELWLGGKEPLDEKWIEAVEVYLQNAFPTHKMFDFRPFKDLTVRKREGGGGAGGDGRGRQGGSRTMERSASAVFLGHS